MLLSQHVFAFSVFSSDWSFVALCVQPYVLCVSEFVAEFVRAEMSSADEEKVSPKKADDKKPVLTFNPILEMPEDYKA